jgi:hypothetical protein
MLQVKQKTLLLLTGIIWLTASFILFRRAYSWLELITPLQLGIGLLVAFPLAMIKINLVFRKLTMKNIERIKDFGQKSISIWEFHLLKDKLLILVMIVLGTFLRHMTFIPKSTLFPIYIGIGIAMFYVWSLYLRTFYKIKNYL